MEMNKNCIIVCIECDGKFVCLDGQDYDAFCGILYTEDEAAVRIDELNRQDPHIRFQVVILAL